MGGKVLALIPIRNWANCLLNRPHQCSNWKRFSAGIILWICLINNMRIPDISGSQKKGFIETKSGGALIKAIHGMEQSKSSGDSLAFEAYKRRNVVKTSRIRTSIEKKRCTISWKKKTRK